MAWFRGAADSVTLNPESKSMVVYGENASGKSSFVDAIEYVINNGKIGHLAHEYSGKHQEKGIINTHTPEGKKTELSIKSADDSKLKIEISRDGSFKSSGTDGAEIRVWDYRRTILRQDEVAAFIHDTKGGKYSALLPLLGLHEIEVAAENLRQLAKAVEKQSKRAEITGILLGVARKQKEVFGEATEEQLLKNIEQLHANYCPNNMATKDPLSRCEELETEITTRIASFSTDQKRRFIIQGIANLDLKGHVETVRSASLKLAGKVEPLVVEKLEVLQSAGIFADRLAEEKEVRCPACGQTIPVDSFQAHIKAEKERLQEIISSFESRKTAIETLCDTIKSLKASVGRAEIKLWRDDLVMRGHADNFEYAEGLNTEAFRTCVDADMKNVEDKLLPLVNAAVSASKDTLQDVRQLSSDKRIIEVTKEVIEATEKTAEVARATALISFLSSLEKGIRQEIRLRSQAVIDDLSEDVQSMWTILHPSEKVENVRLYLPEDADKAIDVGLKFFGVEQDSPRLTLSEGYRNSLGLCIFLAMAKREASKDRPIFLDDVVVSLDRSHRGMIVELLEKEFSSRQVILLTHDREWYTELRQQLRDSSWTLGALMPYETPDTGIRLSARTSTFDDARALLTNEPDSAGNRARKIMDIELALRAERLKIRLPYLHREKNDHRTAHDFLQRLISDGAKCFKKEVAGEYEIHTEAIEAFQESDRLLLSWGNKASHTLDVVRPEAEKLIVTCERALDFFDCPICNKPVYKLDDTSNEFVQCQCGNLRWRYGKT